MKLSANVKGIGFLVLAAFVISIQNIVIKWIGGDYSALQIVALRSLVALPFTLVFYRYEGQHGLPTTKMPRLEYVRGLFLFLSYTTFMMGLAALPLAQIEAIRFSGPLMITFLSVVMLGEKVGPRRWVALVIGFLGVLLIVQPGSASFNLGSVFVLISVLFYALVVIFTRKLQAKDSSATMAYYSSLVYLAAALILVPLPILVGDVPNAHPSIAFLIRPWVMPTLLDGLIMAGLGLIWAGWMYLLSRAYSLAQASVAAPFEYISLPINVLWGFLIWHEIPTWLTLAGATLTLGSGLYVLYRERKAP
ncbi:MAG: DMT family transporter [Ardenticatenaceae bacterium]|nr:DMT family transporter [Anaerolineales bacterium]MCB8940386.1 DMT family transporter [Ardenticatenaceae bacterium]MCB8973402.1 DMT family transporter [Ardenticatenaceae bacterium]